MKIRELLEGPINTSLRTKKVSRSLSDYKNERRRGNDNSGAFSNVKPDADPHMVKKTSNRGIQPGYSEGFRYFIEFIKEHGYSDNPHMPRVYKANKIVGDDGYTIDSYRVEKLLSWEQLDMEELKAVVDNYIHDDFKWHSRSAENYADNLASTISSEVRVPKQRFKIDSLNEACAIVHKAIEDGDEVYGADLHSGNIMFRRTGFGLQPVLNDPLYVPELLD